MKKKKYEGLAKLTLDNFFKINKTNKNKFKIPKKEYIVRELTEEEIKKHKKETMHRFKQNFIYKQRKNWRMKKALKLRNVRFKLFEHIIYDRYIPELFDERENILEGFTGGKYTRAKFDRISKIYESQFPKIEKKHKYPNKHMMLRKTGYSYIFSAELGDLYTSKLFDEFWHISIVQFMEFGLHIGHPKINNFPGTTWTILGIKNDISIIDLSISLRKYRFGYFVLSGAVKGRLPVWLFTGFGMNYAYFKLIAKMCGESVFTGMHWVYGLFTNYNLVFPIIFELYMKTAKRGKAIQLSQKSKRFLALMNGIVYSRVAPPGLILALDAELGVDMLAEANFLNVVVIGIGDTNIDLTPNTVSVPANDDARISMLYNVQMFVRSILLAKINVLKKFFYHVKNDMSYRELLKEEVKYSLNTKILNLAMRNPRNKFINLFKLNTFAFAMVKANKNLKRDIYARFVPASMWYYFEKYSELRKTEPF